jgi:hypothetical protein
MTNGNTENTVVGSPRAMVRVVSKRAVQAVRVLESVATLARLADTVVGFDDMFAFVAAAEVLGLDWYAHGVDARRWIVTLDAGVDGGIDMVGA